VLLNVRFDTQDLCAQIFFTIIVKSTVRHRAKSLILQYLAVEARVLSTGASGSFVYSQHRTKRDGQRPRPNRRGCAVQPQSLARRRL